MKREDEHSKVAGVELEMVTAQIRTWRIMFLYVILNIQAHLKGGVQHTNGVTSTNLKGDGTSVNFNKSPVPANTSTLNVYATPYTCKSDERRHNNCARLPLLKPQSFGGRSLEFTQ